MTLHKLSIAGRNTSRGKHYISERTGLPLTEEEGKRGGKQPASQPANQAVNFYKTTHDCAQAGNLKCNFQSLGNSGWKLPNNFGVDGCVREEISELNYDRHLLIQ